MRLQVPARTPDEQAERDRRVGLDSDAGGELEDEFELADRIAEYASLPAGDPGCRAAARWLLDHDGRLASARKREAPRLEGDASERANAIAPGPAR